MRIVFYGEETEAFIAGFAEQVAAPSDIQLLPIILTTDAQRASFAAAEVIVANKFGGDTPVPTGLKLLHVPAAGYDAINMQAVPPGAVICNSFGHEQAIADYVMAALLARCVPLVDADAKLRRGDWAYWAGDPARVHPEMSDLTIGLYGFGHIGQMIAQRARAFGMRVVVANRSPVAPSPLFDQAFALNDPAFWSAADAIIVSLPLTEDTRGIVGAAHLAAMRPEAVIINVGRGPVIDEQALYDALSQHKISGAVIDTWYRYPTKDNATPHPGNLPFHELSNLVMTPHMSGWTSGTIRRRRDLAARNVNHVLAGEPCENVIRPPQ